MALAEIGARLRLAGVAAFRRGADEAADATGRLGRSVGGLGRIMGRGALLGAGALGAGLAAAGAMGIRTASDMQQAQISFETMLGSAEKAGAFLEELKAFAATTPFEFPELQSAASSLISAGVEASKVVPIMTTLGDVTSGMGTGSEGIKRATIALQQMQAAGRITGEDLNQLRDAGIPVFDLLAAATGKSKAEVVALAQAGKLGKKELDGLMGALESGKGLERFNGLMEKQSKSLAGVWSTLKDNVGMGLADAVAPAIPTITKLVERLGTFAGTAIPKAARAIGGFVRAALPGLREGWESLRESLGRVAARFGGFSQQQNKVANGGTLFGTIVGTALKLVGKLTEAWAVFYQTAVRGVAALSRNVGSLMGVLSNLFTALARVPSPWRKEFKDAASALDQAQQKANQFGAVLDDLAKPRTVTFNVNTEAVAAKLNRLDGRANGGPVTAGRPYVVGEREPEVFVPNVSGRVLNQRQMATAGIGAPVPPIHITVVSELDGRVVARNQITHLQDMQARR